MCDAMLHRLGKLLRSCGVDTVLSDELDREACVHAAIREQRFILSRGSAAQKVSYLMD